MITMRTTQLSILHIHMAVKMLSIVVVLLLIGSIPGMLLAPSAHAAATIEMVNTPGQFQGLCASDATAPHCTNQDPMIQGCSKDAQTIAFHEIPDDQGQVVATLQRRYSPTCRSEWGRILTSPDSHQPVSITIGARASQASPGPVAFTNMVFVPDLSHVSEIKGTISINGVPPDQADGAGLTVILPALSHENLTSSSA